MDFLNKSLDPSVLLLSNTLYIEIFIVRIDDREDTEKIRNYQVFVSVIWCIYVLQTYVIFAYFQVKFL